MIMLCRPNVFLSLCQWSLTVNAPVCRCVRLLIDYNIDINIWDCWDCVLSVIDSVRSVDASFPYVVSMLHLCQCYLLQMLPSVDIFLHRYMGFLGLCSVCYCVRPYLFVPPPSCLCVFTSFLPLISMRLSCVLLIHLRLYQLSLLSMLLYFDENQYW